MRGTTIIIAAALALAAPAAAQGPPTEAEAVALLAGGDWRERFEALDVALALGPDASPELRLAVIEATWAELRGETDTPPESEAIFDYLDAVVELRDPRSIRLLVSTLPMGGEDFLADFGAQAFEPVLAAVADPGGDPSGVRNGLTTLRFMLGDGVLDAGQTERTRDAVRERLTGTQDSFLLKPAVRLALALGDLELREIVQRIADDRATAEALVSRVLYHSGELRTDEEQARQVDSLREYARVFLDDPDADIGPHRRPGG